MTAGTVHGSACRGVLRR